jgi:hypothetical protein
LTDVPGGATWPDISADGRTIVFVGYTADGFDLFTIPYGGSGTDGAAPPAAAPQVRSPVPSLGGHPAAAITGGSERYVPLRTLLPTSWSPILESDADQVRAGAGVAAADVLARHAYAASATWLVNAPAGAATPDAAVPDWALVYAYDRWRPTLFTAASSGTAFRSGRPDAAGRPTSATLRSLDIEAGVLYPLQRVRVSHRLFASLLRGTDRFTLADRMDVRTRNAARLAWATTTARRFGYSISPEGGLSVGATAEIERSRFTRPVSSTTMTADVRGYLAGFAAHHVIALRGAAGVSAGDEEGRQDFHLGGSSSADVIDFGRGAVSLLRGFPSDAFAGTRVALINGEYRFPIARPQRGAGTLPLLLHSVHAAVFGDAGHAWTHEFSRHDLKMAAGGEISFDIVAGYSLPLTITAGAAWGRDGARAATRGTAYVRVGGAF